MVSTTSDTADAFTFPSVDEVLKADAFPTAVWQLEPHREGMLPVAAGRGGPFNIHWEVHGDGPIKLVLIGGLGVFKSSWQRQTLHFGHVHGDKYSVLIFDNRGIGRSDKPLMRYSTSAMAADLIEVLDHLSWTGERQLHICGISMIAQEFAYVAPQRIASLNLLCTAAAIENTTSFTENIMNRIMLLMPKSLDRTIAYTASNIFPESWLSAPDDAVLPDPTIPRCSPPAPSPSPFPSNTSSSPTSPSPSTNNTNGIWPYKHFPNNFTRFAAQEIHKQRIVPSAQLQTIADNVGRERILVLHGTEDRVISPPHGRKLIGFMRPGWGVVVEGMGHAPVVERTQWFNELLAERCALGEQLSGR
ncbi:Alpha/Beta hydrolase protein [Nemania sp. FL0916]|nr:Alpha/Beta hydrolase protein [Nemania sp. FL0916]